MGYVYYVQAGTLGPIKIGFTRDLAARLAVLQSSHHVELRLLAAEEGDTFLEVERQRQFAHLRICGEWFRSGADLMEHITEIAEHQVTRNWTAESLESLAARMQALVDKLRAEALEKRLAAGEEEPERPEETPR